MIVPTILAKKTRRISSGEELVAPTTVLAMVAAFWANLTYSGTLGHHVAQQQFKGVHVRFGSKADIGARPYDVRFTPESRHSSEQ